MSNCKGLCCKWTSIIRNVFFFVIIIIIIIIIIIVMIIIREGEEGV